MAAVGDCNHTQVENAPARTSCTTVPVRTSHTTAPESTRCIPLAAAGKLYTLPPATPLSAEGSGANSKLDGKLPTEEAEEEEKPHRERRRMNSSPQKPSYKTGPVPVEQDRMANCPQI